jgi:hypothetical protein
MDLATFWATFSQTHLVTLMVIDIFPKIPKMFNKIGPCDPSADGAAVEIILEENRQLRQKLAESRGALRDTVDRLAASSRCRFNMSSFWTKSLQTIFLCCR